MSKTKADTVTVRGWLWQSQSGTIGFDAHINDVHKLTPLVPRPNDDRSVLITFQIAARKKRAKS